MIEPNVTFYPLDLTGELTSNRVPGESHPLVQVPGRTNRVLVTKFGGHYTHNFELYDADGVPVPKAAYTHTYLYRELSEMTAKEVMAMVVVTDPTVKAPVTCNYNAVGGFFSPNTEELKAAMDKLVLDELHFEWSDIVGLPEAYPPLPHQDEYWQLYGLDSTVVELNRIADSIEHGMDSLLAEATAYYQSYLAEAQALLNQYLADVNAHLANRNNPHQTNKVKIGLPDMNNWAMSTNAQLMDRSNANSYVPIGGVYLQLQTTLGRLDDHVRDFNNPHQTTAAQVGIWTALQTATELLKNLKWTDTAQDTALFGGYNWAQVDNAVKTNLPADAVTSGRFGYNQLGTGIGAGSTEYVLVGTSQFRSLKDDLYPKMYPQASKVIYFGAVGNQNPITAVLPLYSNRTYYPIGTIAIGVAYVTGGLYQITYDIRTYRCVGPNPTDWTLF